MEWFQKDTEKARKSPRAGGEQLPTAFDPPTVPPGERSLLTSTILVPDRPTQGGRLFTANVQLFLGKSTKPVKAELGKTSKSVTLTPLLDVGCQHDLPGGRQHRGEGLG
jgi:hypothetical protein